MRLAALLTAATLSLPLTAQVTVLQHARVLDGNGGAPIQDATIVVTGHTIQSIEPGKNTVPKGAKVADLSGMTVMPGLISDHSHLGQVKNGKSGPAFFTRDNLTGQLLQWQAYGITTMTSLGMNDPALFYPLRKQAHAGELPGADFFGAGRGIGVPNGAPPINAQPGPYRPSTAEEARKDVREMAMRHTDLIKIWVDDFHGTLHNKMSPEIYRAVINEAHKQHLRAAAHIYYLADAKALVRDGVDILAHGVRDKPVDEELITLMKQKGTWYIATLDLDESTYLWAAHPALMDEPFFQHALSPGLQAHFNDPSWREKINGNAKLIEMSKDALQQNEQNLKRLYDSGIKIGFGTDSGATPERIPGFAEHRELHLMVDAGLTPLQAITIATRNAAALLQQSDRGVLAPGKRADFVVLRADPSSDIDNTQKIESVWRNGKPVSGPVADFHAR